MKHPSLTMAGVALALSQYLAERPKGLFASFIEALHHSRRIQARRILQQNRHLMSSATHRDSFDQKPYPEGRKNGQ
jgi:hypothetical protein